MLDCKALFNRLDRKIYMAERVVERRDTKELKNLIKTIKALINNGRHFLGHRGVSVDKIRPIMPNELIKDNDK